MVRQRKTLKHCLMYDSAFGVKKNPKNYLGKKIRLKSDLRLKVIKKL